MRSHRSLAPLQTNSGLAVQIINMESYWEAFFIYVTLECRLHKRMAAAKFLQGPLCNSRKNTFTNSAKKNTVNQAKSIKNVLHTLQH